MSNFQYESNKILIVLFSSQFSPVALNLVESELNLLCVQSILTVHLHICIYGRALFKQPLSGTDRKHKATSVEERQEQESEEQAEAAEKERKEKNLYVTRPGEYSQASGQGEGKPALFFGSSHIRPQHKHLDNTWFFRH